MFKRIALTAAFLLVVSPVFAHTNPGCEEGLDRTTTSFEHEHCYHDHDTDTNTQNKRESEWGVGVDVELWKADNENSIIEKVTGEYRYDFNNSNGNHSAYLVAHVSLWDHIKGFFNKE